jgi:hypothetical protein
VSRLIVGVELDGAPFPALNFVKWDAYRDGGSEPIGQVTSAIYSPRLMAATAGRGASRRARRAAACSLP